MGRVEVGVERYLRSMREMKEATVRLMEGSKPPFSMPEYCAGRGVRSGVEGVEGVLFGTYTWAELLPQLAVLLVVDHGQDVVSVFRGTRPFIVRPLGVWRPHGAASPEGVGIGEHDGVGANSDQGSWILVNLSQCKRFRVCSPYFLAKPW